MWYCGCSLNTVCIFFRKSANIAFLQEMYHTQEVTCTLNILFPQVKIGKAKLTHMVKILCRLRNIRQMYSGNVNMVIAQSRLNLFGGQKIFPFLILWHINILWPTCFLSLLPSPKTEVREEPQKTIHIELCVASMPATVIVAILFLFFFSCTNSEVTTDTLLSQRDNWWF
jgi:hypothetical protein